MLFFDASIAVRVRVRRAPHANRIGLDGPEWWAEFGAAIGRR
jgi:hypothetical protein